MPKLLSKKMRYRMTSDAVDFFERNVVRRVSQDEAIVADPATGGQKGSKLARFDLLPWEELFEVAELYGVGAAKYAERNWELGYKWSLSFAALLRHLVLFWCGESLDKETGKHHLTSVVFHALAMMHFDVHKKGSDDRSV